MPAIELIKEAERQMVVCNACRYCEGFCAVFPAMELRRTFSRGDLIYLSNLCFDCRDCYYACQFAPPHEFAVNIPQVFSQLRADTYRDYSWPGLLRGLFGRNELAVTLITVASIVLILALVLIFQGPAILFGTHVGEGAFYRVVPYIAMVIPPSLIAIYGFFVFVRGGLRFWRETHSTLVDTLDLGAFLRASRDAFGLSYLKGGEAGGCNYPDAGFSEIRRWLHHLVFYGFLLDLASTTVAAFYDHFLHWQAPYPLLSWPVVLGTVGGIMLIIGTAGLLYLKWRADKDPAEGRMLSMDVAFLVVLFLTSATGLVLLALRETEAMPMLLVIHLGVVAGLFITMPYGKFAHVVYRYAALVRNSLEQARASRGPVPH
ncbi:MAG TPA: tricarballylate utilization 4Fe-4S protein TcuB [Chloroflexota bacterium]|nr:tricarballylate utilization 4Fe-4S protein TcuB [Chloroflexota bacterium]